MAPSSSPPQQALFSMGAGLHLPAWMLVELPWSRRSAAMAWTPFFLAQQPSSQLWRSLPAGSSSLGRRPLWQPWHLPPSLLVRRKPLKRREEQQPTLQNTKQRLPSPSNLHGRPLFSSSRSSREPLLGQLPWRPGFLRSSAGSKKTAAMRSRPYRLH